MTRELVDHDVQVIRAAVLYHEKRLEKSEIARRLEISPTHVSRLLNEAEERGMVSTKVIPSSRPNLEEELRAEFSARGLREICVAATVFPGDKDVAKTNVASLGASFIERQMLDNMTIAVTCGSTILLIFNKMFSVTRRNLTIVPLNAVWHGPGSQVNMIDSNVLVMLAYAKLFGDRMKNRALLFPLATRRQIETEDSEDSYGNRQEVKLILEAAEDADLIVLGVGAFKARPGLLNARGLLDIADLEVEEMNSLGGCGEINLQPFDSDGIPLQEKGGKEGISSPKLNKYLKYAFGKTLDYFRRMAKEPGKRVIGIASGADKTEAFFAAIKGGFFDTAIIDEDLAKQLLALARSRSAEEAEGHC